MLMNPCQPRNIVSYKFLDWSLVAIASIFVYQVATSHSLVNSFSLAVMAGAISIYVGSSYLNLINCDEVQLRYFITGSTPLLLYVEFHNIHMPLGCLFMVYLVIYNSSFTINYIIYRRYFQLIFLSLQIIAVLLATLIIFHNMHLELLDPLLNMKKSTAETFGKVVANELSKVKPPKMDPDSLPAVLDTTREESFYSTERSNSELISLERNQSVLDKLSSEKKVGYYSTERNTFPRICRLSAISSSMFDTLDENVRRSITKNLYAEVEVILDKEPTKSNFLASPRFNQQALNLFELAKSQGPDSPVAITATKRLAETYCLELSTQNMDLNLVKSKVKNIVNDPPVYQGLLFKNPNLFINCQLVESLTPKELNRLLNISNTYLSVWKNYPQPNMLENTRCSHIHNEYLEERFSVKGFSVFSLNKNYSSFSHPQNCWNFLTSLNSNFDKEVLKAYNEYINYIRTVDNDRLQINNEKGLFKKAINFAIPFVSGQTFALVSEEQQKNIVDYSINPRTPYNLIDLAVKGEEITWENLSLLETHNYLLDIPTLGVLQNDLNNYFLSRNIDHLIHCLVKVKENPANFIIQQYADQSTNTTPVNPKWEGKKTIQQCSDGKSMHFKHVNIFGLHVLSQACIFEANSCFIDNHPSKLKFMNEILSNKVITHKLSTDPFFTQGIKIETLTKF